MEFRTVAYFLEVAQKKSFTKAAQSLHISQPTLSKQIRLLEEELGCELFERKPRSVVLTDRGKAFLVWAKKINAMTENVLEEFQHYDEELHGVLRLGLTEQALSFFETPLQNFMSRYPKVQIELLTLPYAGIHARMRADKLSFAAFVEPCDLESYDYFTLPEKKPWGVLIRRNSSLVKDRFRVEDLRSMRLAVPDSPLFKNKLSGWIHDNQRALPIGMTYTTLESLYPLVRSDCIQLLALEPGDLPDDLVFVPLFPRLESGVCVAWNKYRLFSTPEQKFMDLFSVS